MVFVDWPALLLLALHAGLVLGFGLRVMLRDSLSSDTRMAWLAVLFILPYLGAALYFLLGEAHINRNARRQHQAARDHIAEQVPAADLPRLMGTPEAAAQLIAPHYLGAFRYAASINGFEPMAGNQAELMADGEAARDRMVADIDAATEHVAVLYYIWLADTTGVRMADALMRAARRGVACHVMVDGLGSRAWLQTPQWRALRAAGVQTAVALPLTHPLKVMLTSRIDLRNHRKITVIDHRIAWCGSQNCADEAFQIKARFAPWVDIMLRLQGPVVTQTALLFASDWLPVTGQRLPPPTPAPALPGGFAALVFGDGPTERPRATPQLIATLIAAARERLTLSTPYFVPDATVLEALCAAAWRGVRVTLIFPARNDSWIVAAASRATYGQLLKAGVAIHEYRPGLLHAKTLTVDGEVALIGSTNIDLRSFDLNYENNVLLQDAATATAIEARQQAYLAASDGVTLATVQAWPWWRRIWHNGMATLGPVL
ncbi:MAG: cardiolipin synthase [Proteobacteria bacterium]|nr:cardiolipin synthase [Pseudomonadota bacterium]